MKGANVLNCHVPVISSWQFKKMIKVGKIIMEWGGWDCTLNPSCIFSLKKAYHTLIGNLTRIDWCVVHKANVRPKAHFVVWLAMLGKLNTLERVKRWKPDIHSLCHFFGATEESIQHLFLECPYSCEL